MKQDINLYTADGWLNIDEIATLPAWLFVIVGARQVGKTYGTLKHFLTSNLYTLYLRRSREELEAVSSSDDLNPWVPLRAEGFNVDFAPISKNIWQFGDVDEDAETVKIKNKRGIAMSMYYIAKMRGFNGSRFSDMVLDEFIPESVVRRLKNEGDTVLNLYTTVNGNRELEGKPPLRFWLLANAFNLSDPILEAYGLSSEFEKLERSGREWKLLDGGVFICLPHSEKIVKRRSETAQNAYLRKRGAGGAFLAMSLNNSFVYNKSELIRPKSLRGWKPLAKLGDVYAYENGEVIYCCKSPHNARIAYDNTPEQAIKCGLQYPEFRMMYSNGYVSFDSAVTMKAFKDFFGITD